MLTLLSPRRVELSKAADGPYHDPGILTLGVALSHAAARAWNRIAESYWSGHRKASRIQAMSSTSCLPYTHG